MKSVLLVHGGWDDGHCWDLALPHLRERGIEAHTVTMPGNGDSGVSPFFASMSRNAEAICDKLREIGKPTALLGHSMGGYSITAAAEMHPELVAEMIYLTAWVPERAGFNMYQMDLMYGPIITGPTVEAATKWRIWRGVMDVDREKAADFLCPLASPEGRKFLIDNLCPQPFRPGLSKVPWTQERVGSISKHYIECLEDIAIPIEGQRHFQKNMAFDKVVAIPTDHSCFVSLPDVFADAVAEVLN